MTGEQLLNLLMFRLGHRNSPTIRAAAVLEMQLIQQTLEGEAFKPWFLFDEDYTAGSFVTVANTEYVALPTGFLGLDDDAPDLYYLNTDIDATRDQWQKLTRGVYTIMKDYYFEDAPGAPKEWDILGSRIYLRPIPDAVYTLRLPHYRADTVIADTATANQWSTYAADWLLELTLEQVALKHLGDVEMAAVQVAHVQRARARVYREHEQRAHTGRTYEMGSD